MASQEKTPLRAVTDDGTVFSGSIDDKRNIVGRFSRPIGAPTGDLRLLYLPIPREYRAEIVIVRPEEAHLYAPVVSESSEPEDVVFSALTSLVDSRYQNLRKLEPGESPAPTPEGKFDLIEIEIPE
jgi:hypothetical protein